MMDNQLFEAVRFVLEFLLIPIIVKLWKMDVEIVAIKTQLTLGNKVCKQ